MPNLEYKNNGKVRRRRRIARAPAPYTTRNPYGEGSQALTASGRRDMQPMVVEPWMPIFPTRTTKRLRYSSFSSLTSTTGAVASHVLRGNDLFDPDFTSTGHQPMGFDQLMSFYNHFHVVRARLIVIASNTSSAPLTVSIRQDADSTPITVADRIIEFGGLVKGDLEFKGVSGSIRSLELDLDFAKLQGVSRVALTANPSLGGSAAASPVEVTYFHIQAWNSQAVNGSCGIEWILEQEAVFSEPRDLTQS